MEKSQTHLFYTSVWSWALKLRAKYLFFLLQVWIMLTSTDFIVSQQYHLQMSKNVIKMDLQYLYYHKHIYILF